MKNAEVKFSLKIIGVFAKVVVLFLIFAKSTIFVFYKNR